MDVPVDLALLGKGYSGFIGKGDQLLFTIYSRIVVHK